MLSAVALVKSHVSGMGMRFAGYPGAEHGLLRLHAKLCILCSLLSQAIGTPVASNSYNVVPLTFEWRYIPGMTTKRSNNILIFIMLTKHGLLIAIHFRNQEKSRA